MKCPTCNAPMHTLDTRERKDGAVRRSRECPKGHRTTTLEVIVVGSSAGRTPRFSAGIRLEVRRA